MEYRLGIDLGGTSAKIALVGRNNKVIREGTIVTSGFPRPSEVVRQISEVCFSLLDGRRPTHLGVGVAGDIDSERGVVRVSPNLGWKKVPLGRLFRQRLKCRVVVENDANSAAWGLYKTQVPKSIKHVVVMTLGTGVGGGIILNGQLYRGATGSAGEIGHTNIEANGLLCNCGLRGCLETYVGGPHLVKKVRRALERGQKSVLQKILKQNPDQLTPMEISRAARKGDAYALSIWNDVGRALGIAVGDLIYLLNPEWVVFTGGIAQAKGLILKPLWKTLAKRPFKTPVNAVKIKIASDATHIGVIGASLL